MKKRFEIRDGCLYAMTGYMEGQFCPYTKMKRAPWPDNAPCGSWCPHLNWDDKMFQTCKGKWYWDWTPAPPIELKVEYIPRRKLEDNWDPLTRSLKCYGDANEIQPMTDRPLMEGVPC